MFLYLIGGLDDITAATQPGRPGILRDTIG